jgi:Cu-Zn family superoxide dismutase
MKRIFFNQWFGFILLILAVMTFVSCNNEKSNETTTTDSTVTNVVTDSTSVVNTNVAMVAHAEATLAGTYPDTALTGSARFDTANGKVKLVLEITVAAKAGKEVAVHLHEHGDCGDNGKMAHGHWNPTNAQHGKWGGASFHLGDIGNVKLDSKGKGRLEIDTDLWTLGGGPDKNILGKAVIVHGGTDDYTTQPTGNAGSRIGCGVIQ